MNLVFQKLQKSSLSEKTEHSLQVSYFYPGQWLYQEA